VIEQFKILAERVDAFPLRTRVIVFAAAAILLVFVGYSLSIQPLRERGKRLGAEISQQQGELTSIQVQLPRLAQGNQVDPDAANRTRRSALLEELRRLNSRIVDEQRRFTPPDRMRGLLEELLEGNRKLALIDLKTLPVVPVAGQRPGQPGGMYRHGIELSVKGTYAELYEYLRALEKVPNQIYWARAELSVEAHPTLVLKLTVHTLSFDRAWLVV
jgi:MSHA biogenesis protein MshJ